MVVVFGIEFFVLVTKLLSSPRELIKLSVQVYQVRKSIRGVLARFIQLLHLQYVLFGRLNLISVVAVF